MSKYEKYEIVKIKRNEFHGAEYNPRKVTKEAEKKLRAFIRQVGLLTPAAIINKNTMNIVGGHQRINQLDILHRKSDYELTVCIVDLTIEDEMKANVRLNNPSMQGEWDIDLLAGMKNIIPELDFEIDLGFDKSDINFMFANREDLFPEEEIEKEVKNDLEAINVDMEKLKQQKSEYRKKVKEANEAGETYQVKNDDYFLTVVFQNNKDKHDFMKKIKKPVKERFVKASILYDIYDHKISLRRV